MAAKNQALTVTLRAETVQVAGGLAWYEEKWYVISTSSERGLSLTYLSRPATLEQVSYVAKQLVDRTTPVTASVIVVDVVQD